jgi:ATP-dependent RNA helicase RhlE
MAAPLSESPTGFDRFGFHPSILRGILAANFTSPRPIQGEAIPAALEGRDVLGLAETGTGKTAAFALPLLDRFARDRGPGPRALVLAPTRELATQIEAEIRTLARFTKIKVATVFGGVSVHGQVQALRRNPEIVVGCPGRILDLIGRQVLHCNAIETLVLDEADHMFDMGFLPDLKRILSYMPKERQNLLFSATMPSEIRGLADSILSNPHVVRLAHTGPPRTIEHALVPVREDLKRDLLERILTDASCSSAIVFTRTKHRARRLAEQLERSGHKAVGLQGNMSQSQRDRAMEGFRKGRFAVLVATDIVARGIDVQGVSHVINYDVPTTPEAYTHRIGRTGRSEQDGQALTFVTRDDVAWLRATERMLGAPITKRTFEGIEVETLDTGARGGSAKPAGRRGGAPNRSQGRPGGRSGGRPSDRSYSRSNDRSESRPASRPAARPASRSSDRPGPRSSDRPVARTSERSDARPGERLSGRPGQRPEGRSGQRPSGNPRSNNSRSNGDGPRPQGRGPGRPARTSSRPRSRQS